MSESTRTRGLGARHEERRRQLLEALLAIIAEQGLEAVSLRDVAGRAGMSLGAVQHYFRSKDEMLMFALEQIGERGTQRIRDKAGQGDRPTRQLLRDILAELIPSDDQRMAEMRVATAFTARSLVAPELARHQRAGYASLHELLALLLKRAREAGETRADPQEAAATLFALADGLGTHVLIGHRTPQEAHAVLDAELDRLFS